jgi:hypothetical protein
MTRVCLFLPKTGFIMIKKINNQYWKYESKREGKRVKTLYLGKANWIEILLYKLKRK